MAEQSIASEKPLNENSSEAVGLALRAKDFSCALLYNDAYGQLKATPVAPEKCIDKANIGEPILKSVGDELYGLVYQKPKS